MAATVSPVFATVFLQVRPKQAYCWPSLHHGRFLLPHSASSSFTCVCEVNHKTSTHHCGVAKARSPSRPPVGSGRRTSRPPPLHAILPVRLPGDVARPILLHRPPTSLELDRGRRRQSTLLCPWLVLVRPLRRTKRRSDRSRAATLRPSPAARVRPCRRSWPRSEAVPVGLDRGPWPGVQTMVGQQVRVGHRTLYSSPAQQATCGSGEIRRRLPSPSLDQHVSWRGLGGVLYR